MKKSIKILLGFIVVYILTLTPMLMFAINISPQIFIYPLINAMIFSGLLFLVLKETKGEQG